MYKRQILMNMKVAGSGLHTCDQSCTKRWSQGNGFYGCVCVWGGATVTFDCHLELIIVETSKGLVHYKATYGKVGNYEN